MLMPKRNPEREKRVPCTLIGQIKLYVSHPQRTIAVLEREGFNWLKNYINNSDLQVVILDVRLLCLLIFIKSSSLLMS